MLLSLLVNPVRSQQRAFAASGAKVIVLADGRMAVLKPGPAGAVIDGLVDGERPNGAPTDLRVGDVVIRFQRIVAPTPDSIAAVFDATPVGAEVALAVLRDGAERTVTFRRPATAAGSRIAVTAPNAAGAGAWVTGAPATNVSFAIAGFGFRENGEGLPEVTHRVSHPAGASVGLRTGDVVIAFNGRPVAALAGLHKWYGEAPEGGEIALTVTRGAQTTVLKFAKPADR